MPTNPLYRQKKWATRFLAESDSRSPAMGRLIDEPGATIANRHLTGQSEMYAFEEQARLVLDTSGVSTILYPAYLNFARAMWRLSKHSSGETFNIETWVRAEAAHARGLLVSVLEAIGTLHGVSWAPEAPALLLPADHAIDVPLTQLLSWSPAVRALTYSVDFGTGTPPPEVLTGVTALTYDPTLINSTHYYWRIRAVNSFGVGSSAIRDFTTVAP